MKSVYETISAYIEHLQRACGYDVVLFDPFGVMGANSELDDVVRRYTNHTNPVCMTVKGNLRLWQRCVHLKKLMIARLERDGEPFWGECYCGVAEYAYPCFAQGQLIGAVCAAGYMSADFDARRAGILGARLALSPAELAGLRNGSLRAAPQDFEVIELQLGIVAKLIERVVGQKPRGHYAPDNCQNTREQQLLVMQALEYIRQMYAQPIKVRDVAAFCHTSESYLQHLVKNSQGRGIYEILLTHRMDRARMLLRDAALSISDISTQCGYADSNYFSTAFRNRFGVTPGQYRKDGM